MNAAVLCSAVALSEATPSPVCMYVWVCVGVSVCVCVHHAQFCSSEAEGLTSALPETAAPRHVASDACPSIPAIFLIFINLIYLFVCEDVCVLVDFLMCMLPFCPHSLYFYYFLRGGGSCCFAPGKLLVRSDGAGRAAFPH